jgi:hypothetical protein
VKEFADRNIPESGAFNPHAPVYNKIEEALAQFDEYTEHPCCLVLYSLDASFIHLDPMVVFGSALGPLSWATPVDSASDDHPRGYSFYDASKGWYWFDYQQMQPRNTHLVAIIILERFPIGYYRFSAESDRIAKESGKRMNRNEVYQLAQSFKRDGRLDETIPRIIVCQHPFAGFQLSPDFFAGEFDECFGWVPQTARLFAGNEIKTSKQSACTQRNHRCSDKTSPKSIVKLFESIVRRFFCGHHVVHCDSRRPRFTLSSLQPVG